MFFTLVGYEITQRCYIIQLHLYCCHDSQTFTCDLPSLLIRGQFYNIPSNLIFDISVTSEYDIIYRSVYVISFVQYENGAILYNVYKRSWEGLSYTMGHPNV